MLFYKNGERLESGVIDDRGFAYGDGLFETLLVSHGKVPLLEYHIHRLRLGCQVFRIPDSVVPDVEKQILKMAEYAPIGVWVVKVIVTRGQGGRGYQFVQTQMTPNIWCSMSEYTAPSTELKREGIEVNVCDYRLSHNPRLAGIKHLNRLDQVFCAMELDGRFEALVCDQRGYLVEGVKSNVLLFGEKGVLSPEISVAGVRGVGLAYLCAGHRETGVEIQSVKVHLDDLPNFSGLAFVNSVFGVVPVSSLRGRSLEISTSCRKLQLYLDSTLGHSIEAI